MLLALRLLDLASHRQKAALRRNRAESAPQPQAEEPSGRPETIAAASKLTPLRRKAA